MGPVLVGGAVELAPHLKALFGPYIGVDNLNLGSAKNHQPGFVSLDLSPEVGADVLHDCEMTPLPFPDASFDCVLGSHVFEHIVRLVPLVNDLHRILRPGGYLIAVTPYLSSDDAWDCPHHVRAFSENTWHYFSRELYERDNLPHAGFGATQGFTYPSWRHISTHFVPMPEFLHHDEAKLTFMKKHWRNVIQELHVVLQKPEAT